MNLVEVCAVCGLDDLGSSAYIGLYRVMVSNSNYFSLLGEARRRAGLEAGKPGCFLRLWLSHASGVNVESSGRSKTRVE